MSNKGMWSIVVSSLHYLFSPKYSIKTFHQNIPSNIFQLDIPSKIFQQDIPFKQALKLTKII
jgi:hypothetical protein